MAAKKIKAMIKLQVPSGQANPAPPVGPSLGQHGLNIMEFCKQFNEATKEKAGMILTVVITAYEDRSFSFIVKSPPAAVLLKRACSLAKGSATPNREKVGKVTQAQVQEIAQMKMKDLNASNMSAAMKIIAGTARSMGVEVTQ